MKMPTGRERRTIILGLWVVIPALVFMAARPFHAALGEARAELGTQRDLLARELALLQDLERYPAAFRTADSALQRVAPRLFEESDDVLATSRLTSYIAGQALTSHVLFQEAESRPTQRTRDGVRILQIEIRAEGDTEGMLRFLQSLERGPRLVTVQQVAITRAERVQEKGRAPITVLSLVATVNGFALPDSAGSRSASLAGVEPDADR